MSTVFLITLSACKTTKETIQQVSHVTAHDSIHYVLTDINHTCDSIIVVQTHDTTIYRLYKPVYNSTVVQRDSVVIRDTIRVAQATKTTKDSTTFYWAAAALLLITILSILLSAFLLIKKYCP